MPLYADRSIDTLVTARAVVAVVVVCSGCLSEAMDFIIIESLHRLASSPGDPHEASFQVPARRCMNHGTERLRLAWPPWNGPNHAEVHHYPRISQKAVVAA